MMNIPLIKYYENLPVNKNEILRYSGSRKGDTSSEELIDVCLDEAEAIWSNKVCYVRTGIERTKSGVRIFDTEFKSRNLAEFLADCNEIVIFAATVGIGIDRLIEKYKTVSVSRSLVFQAIGADRIESLCNEFCKDIQNEVCWEGLNINGRFSPGYGDFDIGYQKDIFRIIAFADKIGLTLNGSMLMSPSKSVTAIIGLTDKPSEQNRDKCLSCNNKNCIYKR